MLHPVILLLASGKRLCMKWWNNDVGKSKRCCNSCFIWRSDGYPSAGCVTLCSHVQDYYLITKAKKWSEAQRYCREAYTDLATIDNSDDMKRLAKLASANGIKKQIWIGLKRNGAVTWMWSTTETQTSYGIAQYTNWATLPDPSHNCGIMSVDGKWFSAPCGKQLPFICQSGKQDVGRTPTFRPIRNRLEWRHSFCTSLFIFTFLMRVRAGSNYPYS